jgi:hypothetical protein
MSRLKNFAPAWLGWAVGLCVAFSSTLFSGFALLSCDLGDGRLIGYLLEHGYLWVTRAPAHRDLWGPPIFYPHPNTGAYSDILLSAGPFYWCWRLAGAAPDTAYQLWMITVASLNYFAMYLFLARCARLAGLPSAAGAFLFAFASSRLVHMGHFQLHVHFYTVFCLYALYRLFEAPPGAPGRSRLPARAWVAVFFLSAVLQLYGSFYLGWFLGLGLAVAGLCALGMPAGRSRLLALARACPWSLLFWAGVALVPLAHLANHYLEAAREVGLREPDSIAWGAPFLASWASRGPESWFDPLNALRAWGVFHDNPWPEGEQEIGIGPVTSLLVLLGLVAGRHRLFVRLLLATSLTLLVCMTGMAPQNSLWQVCQPWLPAGLISVLWWAFLLLSLGALAGVLSGRRRRLFGWLLGAALVLLMAVTALTPEGSLWLVLYRWVPGASAIRASCRVGLLLLVPASVGLALFLQGRRSRAVALALALVCVLEQLRDLPTVDKPAHREHIARLARRVPAGTKAFLYLGRAPGVPWYRTQLDAMWVQLETGVPTVNGYSGNDPPGWGPFAYERYVPENDGRIKEALKEWFHQHQMSAENVEVIVAPEGSEQ